MAAQFGFLAAGESLTVLPRRLLGSGWWRPFSPRLFFLRVFSCARILACVFLRQAALTRPSVLLQRSLVVRGTYCNQVSGGRYTSIGKPSRAVGYNAKQPIFEHQIHFL